MDIPRDDLEKAEQKIESLKFLVDASTILSSTLDLNNLMLVMIDKSKDAMDAEAASVLLYNPETDKLEFEVVLSEAETAEEILKKKITLDIGQGIAGWVAKHLTALEIEDVKQDARFFADADRLTGFTTRSILAAPLVGRSGLVGVVEVLNPGRRGCDHEIFALLCRQFAIAIENARFYQESLERERLKRALEIAATLQKSFLPQPPLLVRNGLRVSAVNLSASKVGGDVYDFLELAPNRIGVLIGDVSGKGISAALYMARFLFDFRHIAFSEQRPDTTFNRLNALLLDVPRGMFLTAIYGIVDVAAATLSLVVAGHPPFIRANGQGAEAVSVPSGPPLGVIAGEYQTVELPLHAGERIFLLTDGVFDAKNRAGERIGYEKIAAVIRDNRGAGEVLSKIVACVHDFAQGAEQADDLTLVEVSWDPRSR